MLSKSLLALTTVLVSAVSAQAPDLGTVLAGNKDLSTYYSLIQVCSMGFRYLFSFLII